MNPRLRALLERQQKATASAEAITKKAEADGRLILSAEEQKEFDGHMTEVAQLKASITAERELIEAQRAASAALGAQVIDNTADSPTRGFRSAGEFLSAVRNATLRPHAVDQRLTIGAAAPSTYGNENLGIDGGFLVPMEYSTRISEFVLGEDSLLPLTDNTPIDGNSMTFPRDEATPWGTDGVRAYWDGEAQTMTGTKPKVAKPNMLRLNRLSALVPLTQELLDDSSAAEAYCLKRIGVSIRYKTNDAILNGTGAGQPAGILTNNGALVVQAKESGQSANTVTATNVAKMLSRILRGNVSSTRWVMNQEVLPQLITMQIGNWPIYTAPNMGIKDAPDGLLLGRPIIFTQSAAALSSQGDISLIDFSQYRTITKNGQAAGIQIATSMHLYFDAGLVAYRAVFRLDGQPAFTAAVTPASGSSLTLSPFVTLQAR